MTIKERLDNFELLKLNPDERKAALSGALGPAVLAILLSQDSIAHIQAHESIFDDVQEAFLNLDLPQDFESPVGNDWESANEEFKKFCSVVPVVKITTEDLEKLDPSVLESVPDNQLFIQITRNSTKMNVLVDQFLTSTGAKQKILKSGIPFEPTIGEKRMLALFTALFAPEAEDHNKVLVG